MLKRMGRRNPNTWKRGVVSGGVLTRNHKVEMLQKGCFENDEDAKLELFDFIEGCYNSRRNYSSFVYKSPNQSETELQTQN